MDNHRARTRSAKPFKRLDPVLIAANEALNLDARNVGARRHQTAARNKQEGATADCDQRHHDSSHPPECELAPHAATINDGIGIERHGLAPLVHA